MSCNKKNCGYECEDFGTEVGCFEHMSDVELGEIYRSGLDSSVMQEELFRRGLQGILNKEIGG